MNLPKKVREQMLEFCGSIHDDDGIDPKEVRKPKSNREKDRHRQLRLCRQVHHTLALVITNCVSSVVRNLQVTNVLPGKNASYLWVEFQPDEELGRSEQTLDEVRELQGWLRSEIASAISRKQVPNLRFRWSTKDESSLREDNHDD